MPFELTKEQEARALHAFMEVLDGALPANQCGQYELFEKREEEFIRKEVERKLYKPLLPHGGGREMGWAERLEEMARDPDWDKTQAWRARQAAARWREVVGWYYERKPPVERTSKADIKWLRSIRDAAHDAGEWDKKWFAEMLLDGLPDKVADFKMIPLYTLQKPNGDVDRLVRLRNVLGETVGPVTLPPESFYASEYLRKWCLARGNYSFLKGRDQLMKLHVDINRAVAWRNVIQVEAIGWHPLKRVRQPESKLMPGIWFLGDGAYADGKLLRADDDGIYWHDGEGFMVPRNVSTTHFTQKLPMMFPEISPATVAVDTSEETRNFFENNADDHAGTPLARFFREMTDRLKRTMGGLESWMVVGGFAAYAAAPEIFEEFSLFPGVWLHGQAGSGKSTIMEWLMGMWGFQIHSGLSLKSSAVSAVGMMEEADRYSNLPLWADEFKMDHVDENKVGVLHNAFNRSTQVKYNPGNVQRQMRTVFAVSGESTASDAALRGRYAHVQVSAMRREKDATTGKDVNHAKWFEAHRVHFYQFGRFLLENRRQFVELTLSMVRSWRENSPGVSERDKLVYGIPFAAFKAMSVMLQSHSAQETNDFRTFMVAHSSEASEDVASELNINKFWIELLNGFKAGDIRESCFRVQRNEKKHAPQRPEQTKCGSSGSYPGWYSYTLFIDPEATLSELQKFLTKSRESVPLKSKDLRDQLSKNPYWIDGKHRQRFCLGNPGAGSKACWAIDLDTHPMGYLMVSGVEYDAYISPMAENGEDPRIGELYLIVNSVWAKEKSNNQPNL